jgi:medium-chain acyl-[acyl-carrier-protein] hydrolase
VNDVKQLDERMPHHPMRPYGSDRWIIGSDSKRPSQLRLFCFPHAGGGAGSYRLWPAAFPDSIEICAVQLPGREQRHSEPAIRKIGPAADAAVDAMQPYLDRPFALFGHSMGALLAYEVARRLRAVIGREPVHLFVSGRRAPHLPARRPALHRLPDEEFVAGLRALNGTPPEVFEHPELVRLLLPMLRADFEMVETYTKRDGPQLSCPITAMGGNADADVPVGDLAAWQSVTGGSCGTILFEGDHFYVTTARDRLMDALRSKLAVYVSQKGSCKRKE